MGEMLTLYRIRIYSLAISTIEIIYRSLSKLKKQFIHMNYQKDGLYIKSNFVKNAEFNSNCADLIVKEIIKNIQLFKDQQAINIIDLGCGSCDLTHEIYQKLNRVQNLPFNIEYYCIEADKKKLNSRSISLETFHYINSDHKYLDRMAMNRPSVLIQRALTHYFCNTEPQNSPLDFTSEQLEFYSNNINILAPNSILIDIISTAKDLVGLKRFEYILFKLANKRLHYLTPSNFINLVERANKTAKNKAKIIASKILNIEFGRRNFDDLYERYCEPHETLQSFKSKLIKIYEDSKKIFPGRTSTIKKIDFDNYQIDILYHMYCLKIEKGQQ
jgi:hypothetical protein